MIDCKHWKSAGIRGGGDCQIGAYVRPSFGVCGQCLKRLPHIALSPPADTADWPSPQQIKADLRRGGCCDRPRL